MSGAEAQTVLDALADKAILLDMEDHGQQRYVLPPPMAGFFEFSLMRVRGDIDQRMLSELLYEYLNVEEDFIKSLFTRGETQLGRVFVHEPALPAGPALHVLDHERASHIVRTSTTIGVGMCYCRHKMAHVGRACDAPMDICMTFGTAAASLVKHGFARQVGADECLDLLDAGARPAPGAVRRERARGRELHLQLLRLLLRGDDRGTALRVPPPRPHHQLPARRRGRRVQWVRQVRLSVPGRRDEPGLGARSPACEEEGGPPRCRTRAWDAACASACVHRDALTLTPRAQRVITPLNSTHRIVMMAIERGCLQDLVFDNQAFASHRAMAAILGVILELPPVRQLLATRQVRSRYLEALIARAGRR